MACFPRTVYISCNPDTLAANVAALGGSHAVERFAVFDQFPYTPHTESGCLLLEKPLETLQRDTTTNETNECV